MRDPQELLREYAETGSDLAFRQLVEDYINLVYSTACRLVGGDAHLAEDITQEVFVHLSQKARKVSQQPGLGGWLHRDTCFVAARARRARQRRQARERQAMLMNTLTDHTATNIEQLAPVLDEAVDLLAGKDRLAITLRFFEQRDYRSIGLALGTNEDAARMRLNRALEKLQFILKKRGVVVSAAALVGALSTGAVSAAPSGLAGTVAGSVLAGAAGHTAVTASFLKFMAMANVRSGIVTVIVVAGAVTSLVMTRQISANRRSFDESLRQGSIRLAQLGAENDRLNNLAPQTNNQTAGGGELDTLRAQSVSLRQAAASLPDLRRENQRLVAAIVRSQTPLQATEARMVKGAFVRNWAAALVSFSMKHDDMFPTSFEQAAAFQHEANLATNISTAEFEIVYQGKRDDITDPDNTIIIREKQAWLGPDGNWYKEYGFANGVGQLHTEPDGNFDMYESQHMPQLVSSAK
jgi:RNA polymerase sigma factor (sigma-70 family)